MPYFEVDLTGASDRQTTLFSINNAGPESRVAHVIVWSDLSVPVLGFFVYLTGYDVQTINLRDLLVDGPGAADRAGDQPARRALRSERGAARVQRTVSGGEQRSGGPCSSTCRPP